MWGCRQHWQRLPAEIRSRIWATYRAGQEIDKRPSAAYIEAARAAETWAEEANQADRDANPTLF